MPGRKDPGPSVKDKDKYEALRREGASKEKAARIANTPNASAKGGHAEKYEGRTRDELYEQAGKVGIEGRSDMTRDELIDALRNH